MTYLSRRSRARPRILPTTKGDEASSSSEIKLSVVSSDYQGTSIQDSETDTDSIVQRDLSSSDSEIVNPSASSSDRPYFAEETWSLEITNAFLTIIREEDFEFGFISRSEEFLNVQLQTDALSARNWLNELFVKNFHDDNVIIGILRIVGRFKEHMIFPQGQTMALAALSHRNIEIKELGVRAFERWVSYDSLRILRTLKVDTQWLQEYIDQVICDLEEQLYVDVVKKNNKS